jgi:hypothetical protein
MPAKKPNAVDEAWDTAQSAFEAARKLPAGSDRFEALKKAGRLRYEADKKRTRQADRSNTDKTQRSS